MKTRSRGHTAETKIPRYVWMLSAVGMAAGVLTLGMEYRALTKITAQRERTKVAEAQASTTLRVLCAEREKTFRDLDAHLRGRGGGDRPADSLDPFIAQCGASFARIEAIGTTSSAAVRAMEASAANLTAVHRDLERHEEEKAHVGTSLREAWAAVQRGVLQARSATEKLEGRERLLHELMLRRYRAAPDDDKADLAFEYIDALHSVKHIRTLTAELGELTLLAERLYAERRTDQLVSLKDNQLRQTLTWIDRAVEKTSGIRGEALAQHVASLQSALFGEGVVDDADHQTLVVGQGGLFSFKMQALTLDAEAERLRGRISSTLGRCLQAEQNLDHVLDAAMEMAAVHAEGLLRSVWRDTLVAGLVVFAAFAVLSWRIARLGRQAEVELRTNNEALELANSEIRSRSTELEAAMQQLEAARQDAETASHSKSEFLANMSHEIRTPMTAILGFTENMFDAGLAESEKLNALQTVRRNGEHLLQLINDILDISKIEAGKLDVEHVDCSPLRLAADVKSLMQVRADAKGLPFNIEFIGTVPETIQSDPTRLKQILVNLVGNAIKFTEAGGVRLVTRFVDTDPIGGKGPVEPMMQFDIVDTGIGMTKEQAGRMFQAFSQADTSMTRKFGGTGLGLNISKRLAELLGGDITVDSKPDEGSTFRVRVMTGSLDGVKMLDDPAKAASVQPESVAEAGSGGSARAEARGLAGDPSHLDCRILLAEDGPDNQQLISFVLKRAGADVTIKEDGKLALDAALAAREGGDPFGVILMDMQMPVMDGYEATEQLRQAGYTGPIIALTAHAMASDRQKCLDAGCDDYATKPIDRKMLIATIQEWLQKRPVGGKEHVPMADSHEAMGALVSELAGDPDMAEMVELFIAELPEKLAAVEKALSENDLDVLSSLAHQLKGAGGGYGFPSITKAAKQVESSAKTGNDLEALAEQTHALAELCGRASVSVATT